MNVLIVPRDDLNTFVPVVAWTLAHEVFFYLMTFASLLLRRVGRILLVAWLVASTVISLAGIELQFPWSFVFSSYNMAFGLGFLAFKLNHAYSKHIPARVCLWTGVAGFFALGCIESFLGEPAGRMAGLYFTVAFFAASFLLVLGFLSRPASWIRPIGNASYSIYLVHYPLLVVLCMLAKRVLGSVVPATPLFLLMAVLALAGGGLYYLLVERPGLRLFGRRLDT
jgi:peptidoglycan/LPS O-acetylase OafA/YrhL